MPALAMLCGANKRLPFLSCVKRAARRLLAARLDEASGDFEWLNISSKREEVAAFYNRLFHERVRVSIGMEGLFDISSVCVG